MRLGGSLGVFSLCVFWAGAVWGQTAPAAARIETVALRLTMPEAYQVTVVLEPIRRVTVVAPTDGVVRSLDGRLGGMVRESQELAQLDRSEATAKLKMAAAEVKEKQALVNAGTGNPILEVYRAQLEAAQARAELAQLELARCTVRAPFAGRVLDVPVSPGQYVLKGTPIAELADTTSLRAILPIDRRAATPGATLTVPVEEREASCRVQAILPLPESFAVLRELATPFSAALVQFPNARGELEAGQRVRPAGVPTTPLATVPRRAVRPDEVRGAAVSMVQVIRNEYVQNVPVQVLGAVGPDRVQVAGPLRDADALVVGSSVPLSPGTLVRFGEHAARGIEGTSPNPAQGGYEAGITPPAGARSPAYSPGAPTASGPSNRRGVPAVQPTTPPAQAGGGNATPF
jgi:multidrug efflux pump subunit AcrA (membrane-fusion protein)